ncbi:MAG: DUF5053 domain-containing protein [Candidatus Azobacteroides sp.]|nr:DUF5053 domain-containing protein [Candidatus Azobacteroides sp.]
MDKYKKQQLELDELRREFISLDTEEQRADFDKKMKQVISSKNDEEKELFSKAFVEGAEKACEEAKELIEYVNFRSKLDAVYNSVSWSYVADKYFGKSRAWLNQRINGFLVNGKKAQFTKEEKNILSNALIDMGNQMQNIAHSF